MYAFPTYRYAHKLRRYLTQKLLLVNWTQSYLTSGEIEFRDSRNWELKGCFEYELCKQALITNHLNVFSFEGNLKRLNSNVLIQCPVLM